jgi:two-component system OmpR family response regulator
MNLGMPRRTGRLLIVDDDEGVRRAFAGVLETRGHEVQTAATADEGLRDLGSFRPDAILLDLRMPLVNGFGFLYRLRSHPRCGDLPVAIITGDCTLTEDSLIELRALGAELRHKPIGAHDLIALADLLLSQTPLTVVQGEIPSDCAQTA